MITTLINSNDLRVERHTSASRTLSHIVLEKESKKIYENDLYCCLKDKEQISSYIPDDYHKAIKNNTCYYIEIELRKTMEDKLIGNNLNLEIGDKSLSGTVLYCDIDYDLVGHMIVLNTTK